LKKLYYLHNNQSGYVGNSMSWWAIERRGYTCDIRCAHVWSEEEMQSKVDSGMRSCDVFYPKDKIDALIQHHIDVQDIPYEGEKWPIAPHPVLSKRPDIVSGL